MNKDITIVGYTIYGLIAALKASKKTNNIILITSSKNDESIDIINDDFIKYNDSLYKAQELKKIIKDELLSKNVEIWYNSFTKISRYEDGYFMLDVINQNGISNIKTKALILDQGELSSSPYNDLIPSTNLYGVLSLESIYNYYLNLKLLPVLNPIIYGINNNTLGLVNLLNNCGVEIRAIMTNYSKEFINSSYIDEINKLNIPVYFNTKLISFNGINRINEIEVSINNKRFLFDTDSLIYSNNFYSNLSLINKYFKDYKYNRVDQFFMSDIDNLFIVGKSLNSKLLSDSLNEISIDVGLNSTKTKRGERKLINILKSDEIEYIYPNILDLSVELNTIKFYISIPQIKKYSNILLTQGNNEIYVEKIDDCISSINIDFSKIELNNSQDICISLK